MHKSRKKLTMWSALPPYLGGKRRLCPVIFREIDRLVPRRLWANLTFLDGFLGGGSVSLYAKAQGLRVIATDIAARSITIGRALIENSRVRLTEEDVLRLAAASANTRERSDGEVPGACAAAVESPPGRLERDYAPSTFTKAQARFLDRALEAAAATADPAKAALIRLLAIRVALLAHPYSQVRRGTIHRVTTGEFESITESAVYHYIDGLRLIRPDKLWALARQINAGVFQGDGRVLQASILDVLPSLEADIAYFDPPYPGVMSYEREYKIIDEILEGASRPTSPFTARDGAGLIDGLFERARHIPIWLLSLGNAVVGISDLEEKMRRLGRETRAIAIHYQHLPAVATEEKKQKNREFLVVGWDADARLVRDRSVLGGGMADGVSDTKLGRSIAMIDTDVDPVGPEGAPAQALANDPFEKREPRATDRGASGGRVPVAVLDPGIDLPDAVLVEAGDDRGSEGRLGPVGSHAPSIPPDRAQCQTPREIKP